MHETEGDEQLYEVARIKRAAEERIMRRAEFGTNIAAKLYTVLVLFIAGALWIGKLQWQVAQNAEYIEAEKRDPSYSQRLHDQEEQGKRRDRDIDKLIKRVFGFEP